MTNYVIHHPCLPIMISMFVGKVVSFAGLQNGKMGI